MTCHDSRHIQSFVGGVAWLKTHSMMTLERHVHHDTFNHLYVTWHDSRHRDIRSFICDVAWLKTHTIVYMWRVMIRLGKTHSRILMWRGMTAGPFNDGSWKTHDSRLVQVQSFTIIHNHSYTTLHDSRHLQIIRSLVHMWPGSFIWHCNFFSHLEQFAVKGE